MNNATLDDKVKETEKIYDEVMAKLNELEIAHQQILATAKRRVEEERIEKIKQDLLKT
jgi:fido (protein-threonine AMPylation protein)